MTQSNTSEKPVDVPVDEDEEELRQFITSQNAPAARALAALERMAEKARGCEVAQADNVGLLAALKANRLGIPKSSPSGQVAEDEKALAEELNAPSECRCSDCLRDKRAALSRLAARAQGYEAMKAERDSWRGLTIRLLALAGYLHAQWSRMADLWRRVVTEGALMRLALEAQERANGIFFTDPARLIHQKQADRLRASVLSSSRPHLDAVPLGWVREALLECPHIPRLSAEAVMEALGRAAAEGHPVPVRMASTSDQGLMRWARVCPSCHHEAHQPGACPGEQGPCSCQTRVRL